MLPGPAAPRVHRDFERCCFVVAPSAYGGSAMVRALAALPLALPAKSRHAIPPVAVEDIAVTVTWLAAQGPTISLRAP